MTESGSPGNGEPRGPRKGKKWAAAAILAIILLVAAFMVGPRIYSSFASSDEEAPTLSGEGQTSGDDNDDGGGQVDDGAWSVGESSYAGYRVDEILRGEPVTVVGRTETVTGEASIAGGSVDDASVEVDMASIATDNGRRDQYFREALGVDSTPTSTFTISEPIDLSDVGPDPVKLSVPGELRIGEETREVTAELEVAVSGETIDVAGTVPITWADFGIDAPSMGFVEVEDSGAIEFLLHLNK